MNEEKEIIWNQPVKPVSEIMEQINKSAENPPDTIEINITLDGNIAKSYFVMAEILKAGFDMTDEEVAEHLLLSGVNFQLAKLHMMMNQAGENEPLIQVP